MPILLIIIVVVVPILLLLIVEMPKDNGTIVVKAASPKFPIVSPESPQCRREFSQARAPGCARC